MRVALMQLNSRDDKAANIETIAGLLETHIGDRNVDLVAAPEYGTFFGGLKQEQWDAAETFPDGEGYKALQALAKRYGVAFHTGSMIERDGNKHYNTSVVFGPDGTELARYRKIHLFDVETPGGHIFRESDTIDRGSEIVDFTFSGKRFGCSICYDIRFSELYLTHMRNGCDVIMVPAAFNMETGKDHWETLLRARAIETQSWVIAAGQIGLHREAAGERASYGNSMIIDPWGTIVARASAKPGVVIADIDFGYADHIRTILPSNTHHVLS
ncbi:carbon-nitrogen hydrolase family protein [Pelagibacterium halotolerans]|uniref:Putative amidohydrolase n=1 Tax=Pelagibacterium halotolerans (strain DSM 22347 / JCM 15775 / CGMCC 1.7692 / B2) TaxID=1082931 RepID=G4RD56_PELHB|nr:carbon-nitrogen hydrolase family protein [Pelagibacterium halotolerans]AEQ53806.1 putative amidohydrolase [Pelagibacterium halotolerans B2]QJR20039.1 carbon-nitrogen hydrolase family protein [Pelagibacterium halotolerans]SEA81383.1 nitrilase [Pelagibacterium halotolerans]